MNSWMFLAGWPEVIAQWTPWTALALTVILAIVMTGRNRSNPSPDFTLRLAAMISQIYAVMMLVLLLCCLLQTIIGAPHLLLSKNPQLLLAMLGWAALWILSVGQCIASRQTVSGCVWARNWGIFSWLAYFAALQWPFHVGYWGAAMGLVALGIWSRQAGMKRGRRAVLAVTALVTLLVGFGLNYKDFIVTVSSLHSSSSSGIGVAARLQKIHVIPGTTEATTLRVAEALVRNLNAAGIVAEIADPAAVADIDSSRELALWLGRGVVSEPPSQFKNSNSFSGKPAYVLKSVGNNRHYSQWKGFLFPTLYVSTEMRLAVSRDGGNYSANKVAKEMSEKLLSALKPLIGSDTIVIPALPESETAREVLTAPELRNFRLIARSHGSGTSSEVYAFEKTDHDADIAAVTNLLNASGITTQHGPYNGTYSFYGNGQAELLYWQGKANPASNFYSHSEMDLSTALLEISSDFRPDNERDPEFVQRFLADDPVGFLCSSGARQLEEAQRLEVLRQTLPRTDLPFAIRLRILENLMYSSPELAEGEKELLEEYFRKLAGEVLAKKSYETFQNDISSLHQWSQREGWRHLETWLTEQLGDRYVRIEVKGTPGATGLLEMEKVLKPASILDSLYLVEFFFDDFEYRPMTLWLGISRSGDQQWVVRSGNSWSTQGNVTFPVSFYSEYKLWEHNRNIPRQLSECASGGLYDQNDAKLPEPGGMVLTCRMDDKESAITLRIRFAPLIAEEAAWQTRLMELPSYLDDPEGFEREVLALADDLASRKEQNGFLPSAMKLLTLCHASAVRQKVAERLGESYCRIELPTEPDADGLLKGEIIHPVGSVTDTQVICEIDGSAAGEPVVFVSYGIKPDGAGAYMRNWNSKDIKLLPEKIAPYDQLSLSGNFDLNAPGNLSVWSHGYTSGATPLPKKFYQSGQSPTAGNFHLTLGKDPETQALYFLAIYRPQED